MNKTNKYILILVCFFLSKANCQINLNFELWKTGNYYDPEGWLTSNHFTDFGANFSCNKSTMAYEGIFSAQLNSVKVPDIDTIPAFIIQKASISQRINSVNFFYQYTGGNLDSPFLQVLFYKKSISETNVIGECIIYMGSNSKWTELKQNVKWKSTENPDSVTFYICTSQKNLDDTLYIDNINLSLFNVKNEAVKISPFAVVSRDKRLAFFKLKDFKNSFIRLSSSSGVTVLEQKIGFETIDVSFLSSGVYFYEIISGTGTTNFGKILIY